jgi:hypothetical protein
MQTESYGFACQKTRGWSTNLILILDIDLNGLPASKRAEGSRKGYFGGKNTFPRVEW